MKLAALAVLSLCGAALSGPPDRGPERPAPHLNSPNGLVGFELARDEANRLAYTVTLGRDVVVEPSSLGVIVDGKNLAAGSVIAGIDRYAIDEKYAWLGFVVGRR